MSTLVPQDIPRQETSLCVSGEGATKPEPEGERELGIGTENEPVGGGNAGGQSGGAVNGSTPAQEMQGVPMEGGANGAGSSAGDMDVEGTDAANPLPGEDSRDFDTESEDELDEESQKGQKKFRRACDYCTTKKVRCDGSPPCRQCKKRQMDCQFSMCQRTGPRPSQDPATHVGADRLPLPGLTPVAMAAAVAAATAAGAAVGGAGPPPSSQVGSPTGGTYQMTTALSGGGITSKIDVTYLNFFLKEFNAFVPLTTQDILKDALSPTPAALTERSPNGDEEYRRQNARVAVIQGCISIGAMLKGNTQVVGYMRNVREALTNSFDFVTAETMGAYMVAAYCHDLMGNAAATRNYMEFAKAVASQLPQVTVDHELVFQFYRVCSEVHNSTLSITPKLLQYAGAASPCYQVLNVLTYALYDLAHLAAEELAGSISKAQVIAELNSLLPIIARADGMSRDNASSFGALGMLLVKGVLAYILVRLGRNQKGLEVLRPLVKLLKENPGILRQVMCWHLCHSMLVIFLEHGWFKEYETVRGIYNHLLCPQKNEGQHFTVWGRGHFQGAMPYPPVERLHLHGNSFLCLNPICKAINRDLSEGVEPITAAQVVGVMGPQPVINMVTGEGFINFDSEEGVNLSNHPNQGAPSPQYTLPGFAPAVPQPCPPQANSPVPVSQPNPPGALDPPAAAVVPSQAATPTLSSVGRKRALVDHNPKPGTENGVPQAAGAGFVEGGGGAEGAGGWNSDGSVRDTGGVSAGMNQEPQPEGDSGNTTPSADASVSSVGTRRIDDQESKG